MKLHKLLVLALVAALTPCPVSAQTSGNRAPVAQPPRTIKVFDANPGLTQKTVVSGDQVYSILPQPPDMPYVPVYTGQKKFFRGRKIVNTKTGNSGLEASYLCKESQADVINWYKAALEQMGWKMKTNMPKGSCAGDRFKDGYRCVVNVHNGPDREYQTVAIVNMSIYKPLDMEEDPTKPRTGPVTNSKPAGGTQQQNPYAR
jgi:hypothetical protein